MRIESDRLYLYPISDAELKNLIDIENNLDLKQAYSEMLVGCVNNQENRIWYALWNIELKNQLDKDKIIVGNFSFKGLNLDGIIEIGYGLKENFRHKGYMIETIKTISKWALSQKNIKSIEAETAPYNKASQKVLLSAGFIMTEKFGKEGSHYKLTRDKLIF